jgi:hypothetical protein
VALLFKLLGAFSVYHRKMLIAKCAFVVVSSIFWARSTWGCAASRVADFSSSAEFFTSLNPLLSEKRLSFLGKRNYEKVSYLSAFGRAEGAMTTTDDQLNTMAVKKEEVVKRYFDGVTKKDLDQIISCFAPTCNIRDVCRLREGNAVSEVKTATREQMADRCMEFLAAHSDCQVDFHYGYVYTT